MFRMDDFCLGICLPPCVENRQRTQAVIRGGAPQGGNFALERVATFPQNTHCPATRARNTRSVCTNRVSNSNAPRNVALAIFQEFLWTRQAKGFYSWTLILGSSQPKNRKRETYRVLRHSNHLAKNHRRHSCLHFSTWTSHALPVQAALCRDYTRISVHSTTVLNRSLLAPRPDVRSLG